MTGSKYRSKQDLVDEIVSRQDEILSSDVVSTALLDCLVPLSGHAGRIMSIDDGGNVNIEFSVPIQSYLSLLTRKKLVLVLDALDQGEKKGKG